MQDIRREWDETSSDVKVAEGRRSEDRKLGGKDANFTLMIRKEKGKKSEIDKYWWWRVYFVLN